MRQLVSLPRLRKFAVLTAVGGSMLLGSVIAAGAASAGAAAPAPNASAISDAQGLRVTGLSGPNKITVRAVSGQNLFLATDTAPITAGVGCAAVPAQVGLFRVQCRALPGSVGDIQRDSSGIDTLRGNGGQDDLITESNAAGAARTSWTAVRNWTPSRPSGQRHADRRHRQRPAGRRSGRGQDERRFGHR